MLGYLPTMTLNEAALSRGLRMDEHLPLALSRIAAGLQAGRGLDEVLETTGSFPAGGEPSDGRTGEGCPGYPHGVTPRMPCGSWPNDRLRRPRQCRHAVGKLSACRRRQYATVVSEACCADPTGRLGAQPCACQGFPGSTVRQTHPAHHGWSVGDDGRRPATSESFRTGAVQITIAISMTVMLMGFLQMRKEIRRVV